MKQLKGLGDIIKRRSLYSNYYHAQLMLYYPWRDEDHDLLSNCATYEEHYRSNVKQVVDTNEAKYSVTPDYNNVLQYNEDGPSS